MESPQDPWSFCRFFGNFVSQKSCHSWSRGRKEKDNSKIFLAVSNSRILSDKLLATVWYPSIDVIGRFLKSRISVSAVGGAAPLRAGRHHRTGGAAGADCCRCRLSRVHICLLLRLHDVLLVADPLVSEPVANLWLRLWFNGKVCLPSDWPEILWCRTSWPAPPWPPRWGRDWTGASRNIRSGFHLTSCWNFDVSASRRESATLESSPPRRYSASAGPEHFI